MSTTAEYNASPLIPLLVVTGLSSWGLFLSYQNITRLRTYEEQTEKAAKWSSIVSERLKATRSTQASGTLSLVVSVLTAVVLVFTKLDTTTHAVLSAVNVIAIMLARFHMSRFWNDRNQTQIPFMGKYNQAIRGSEDVVQMLGLIAAAWVAAGLLSFL